MIPSLHTFGVHYNTINILWYASVYIEIVLKTLYYAPLCFVTTLFFKTILAPHYSTNMCHDMFIKIQIQSISHESHKSYWLVKYLNLRLISWKTNNTCWTYICQSSKTIFDLKLVTRIYGICDVEFSIMMYNKVLINFLRNLRNRT